MRLDPLAIIAGSIVIHVGLMAMVGAVDPPEKPKKKEPTVIEIVGGVKAPAPAPIDVVVLPAPEPVVADAPPPAPAAAAVRPPVPSRGRPVVAGGSIDRGAPAGAPTGEVGAATGTGTPGAEETPGGYGMLSMRRPKLPDLSKLSAHIDIDGGRPPPPPIVPSGELHASGGGTHRAHLAPFDAHVARDGRVRFEDRKAFSVKLTVPNPVDLGKGIARGIETWYDDPGAAIRAADRVAGRDEGPGIDIPTPGAARDLPTPMVMVPVLGGSSEITDWVMRQGGIDPYMSAKRDFLERTREERTELRKQDELRRLKQTVVTVRKHVARIWSQANVDAATRRAAIFEIWDDCAEDELTEDSAARVAAGADARTAIVGFVRANLPAGSPDAFTPAELAALNQRRTSKARFDPY